MGKKKNHSATAAAGSSSSAETKAIEDLKSLNDQLVKEVAKCRKQIQQLQIQLVALASHHNFLAGSEPNVLPERQCDDSSSVTEAAAQDNTEMAVKMTQSTTGQLDATEMRLLAVVREKDEIHSNMERIIVEKDCTIRRLEQSLEQSRKKSATELAGSEYIATERQSGNSSSTTEATTQDNTEMAVKMTESTTAQLDVTEMRLLAAVREKDEIQSNMERITAEKDCTILRLEKSLEQSMKKSVVELAGGRKWKRWIYSAIVATASFGVAAAVVNVCFPKSSISKN